MLWVGGAHLRARVLFDPRALRGDIIAVPTHVDDALQIFEDHRALIPLCGNQVLHAALPIEIEQGALSWAVHLAESLIENRKSQSEPDSRPLASSAMIDARKRGTNNDIIGNLPFGAACHTATAIETGLATRTDVLHPQ